MVRVLWVGDHKKRVLDGVLGQSDVLVVWPRRIGRRGQRIDIYCHPPHDYVDKSCILEYAVCSGYFLLGRQGGAPGITCAAAPTHGGAVCGVRPFVDEGGVASSPSFALVS